MGVLRDEDKLKIQEFISKLVSFQLGFAENLCKFTENPPKEYQVPAVQEAVLSMINLFYPQEIIYNFKIGIRDTNDGIELSFDIDFDKYEEFMLKKVDEFNEINFLKSLPLSEIKQ